MTKHVVGGARVPPAGIRCLECKGTLDRGDRAETSIRERAVQYERDKDMVQSILMEGSKRRATSRAKHSKSCVPPSAFRTGE
jgi:hypothetical protein